MMLNLFMLRVCSYSLLKLAMFRSSSSSSPWAGEGLHSAAP